MKDCRLYLSTFKIHFLHPVKPIKIKTKRKTKWIFLLPFSHALFPRLMSSSASSGCLSGRQDLSKGCKPWWCFCCHMISSSLDLFLDIPRVWKWITSSSPARCLTQRYFLLILKQSDLVFVHHMGTKCWPRCVRGLNLASGRSMRNTDEMMVVLLPQRELSVPQIQQQKNKCCSIIFVDFASVQTFC